MMTDTKNANILIVDDTPANLDLLHNILTRQRYRVRALPSGALAVRSAQNNPPDLILLDIKMPGMDGYEVCAELKADPRTREIPVIFISALQETEDKVRAFEAGGVDYVIKPFQSEEVLARVSTHLHLRALQKNMAEAKDRAETANRAKSAFLANMSHELRTPLNAVLGFAQIMAMDADLNCKYRRNAEHILRGGELLLELLNDVLDLAKIEAGCFECVPKDWTPRDFFQELSMMFRIRAEQKNLFLRYEEGNPLPRTLCCDARRLRQIVMNLLSNAVKFTMQGGITLRTEFSENKLAVTVTDTGPGIPSHMLEKIFEPFQQAGDSKQKIQGTGLGLAITRKLAEMMNGVVTVAGTEGKGIAFRVEIPVQAAANPEQIHEQTRFSRRIIGYRRTQGEQPLRILVCDDVFSNREVLRSILTSLKFEVLIAKNGEECVDMARNENPDAILLDLYMSELNGFDTVRILRELPAFRELPIISVSANPFAETPEQSLKAGCNAHFSKPVNLIKLYETLGKLLPLEWKHAREDTEDTPIAKEDFQKISPQQRQRLLDAITCGNISAIITLSEKIGRDAHCLSVAQKISEFARNTELKKLNQLLEL